jgi:hypothetical protein
MDLIAYLLCYTLELKDKPREWPEQRAFSSSNTHVWCKEQHGLCRALSYIVQTLSADPAFGPKLTKPVKAQLPVKWNAAGTAADFMINVCRFIVSVVPFI